MNNLADTYLFKALDAYPYDLPEVIESLNYALSYDEKNPIALRLMGQIHAEQLQDYETAKLYFEEALAEDVYTVSVYSPYLDVLIWNEDFEKALKLIDFALTVKGVDKALIHYKRALVYEYQQEYKLALKALKMARRMATNSDFISARNLDKKRIKGKITQADKFNNKRKTRKMKNKKKS